jgi:hypothetical protein
VGELEAAGTAALAASAFVSRFRQRATATYFGTSRPNYYLPTKAFGALPLALAEVER